MSLTTNADESVTLGKERHHVCLESVWELDALGALLGKLEGEGLMAFQVRAIAVRIDDLAGVLMMAISDTGAQTDDLIKTVCPWKP